MTKQLSMNGWVLMLGALMAVVFATALLGSAGIEHAHAVEGPDNGDGGSTPAKADGGSPPGKASGGSPPAKAPDGGTKVPTPEEDVDNLLVPLTRDCYWVGPETDVFQSRKNVSFELAAWLEKH